VPLPKNGEPTGSNKVLNHINEWRESTATQFVDVVNPAVLTVRCVYQVVALFSPWQDYLHRKW
jgi:hypothetical protein